MQAREKGLPRIACALAAAVLLAAPASAGATVRFASPTGGTTGTCTSAEPACSLQHAVEVVAMVGDEVIVTPGTYNEGTNPLMLDSSKYVHGASGQAIPQINFTNPPGTSSAVRVTGNALIARATIRQTAGDGGDSALQVDGGSAEQLLVRIDAAVSSACHILEPGGLLRDSVCWSPAGTAGARVSAAGDGMAPAESVSATIRNLTAVGSTRGLLAEATGGAVAAVDAKNVIADGPTDVEASAGAGDTTSVGLENSNYATTTTSGAGTHTVTAAGSGSNQTAAPAFVSAASGDFHQLASSPTVDAGTNVFQLGSLDLDGDPRSLNGAPSCLMSLARPDIGADELVPASLDCLSPETGIVGAPKARTPKRRAGFTFVSTEAGSFQCSLDEKPFGPCVSPQAYRKLKPGKHVFTVRAVDLAGNLDTSPAERTWRITAKKKHR